MGSLASLVLPLLCAIALPAQDPPKVAATGEEGGELPPFYCPMDLDVRSYAAGKCYKCSMEMVLGAGFTSEDDGDSEGDEHGSFHWAGLG